MSLLSSRVAGLVVAALLFLGGTAAADAPLPLPTDYARSQGALEIVATVAPPRTVIHGPAGSWEIPIWARWPYLLPGGHAILVLNDGGNLIGARDPDFVVAEVWTRETAAEGPAQIRLGEVMDPGDLVTTASHYVWLSSVETRDDGWTLVLIDGREVRITPVP